MYEFLEKSRFARTINILSFITLIATLTGCAQAVKIDKSQIETASLLPKQVAIEYLNSFRDNLADEYDKGLSCSFDKDGPLWQGYTGHTRPGRLSFNNASIAQRSDRKDHFIVLHKDDSLLGLATSRYCLVFFDNKKKTLVALLSLDISLYE